MAELYAVEVKKAPIQAERFATYYGVAYSGLGDIKLVALNKVITVDRLGAWFSRHNYETCVRLVDDMHRAVKQGSPQKWLASSRVVRYILRTKTLEPVYTGLHEERVVEENPSLVRLAFDGTYRQIPNLFEKTPRGWKFPYSIIADSNGIPRADWITGITKTEILDRLFDNSYQLSRDIVATYPLADPKAIPASVLPTGEYVPTQAELDATLPLNYAEWQLIPTAEHKRKYAFDPIYRAAFGKMFVVQAAAEEQFAQKQAAEKEAEELEKMKKQFLSEDADARRKEGPHA